MEIQNRRKNAVDKKYIFLCRKIFKDGKEYNNISRDVKRLQIPSWTFKHSFDLGFPAIGCRQLRWKSVVKELLWFLKGDNDIEYLNKHGVKMWNKDAYNWYIKNSKEKNPLSFEVFSKIGKGSVGQNYSVQWRNFNGNTDQIKNLIDGMRENIMSSRLKVNAWNPSEVNKTALPPCHSEFQIVGVPLTQKDRLDIYFSKNKIGRISKEDEHSYKRALEVVPAFGFELHWNQRSTDVFLGLPFNIASYGLLAKILEKITKYPALGIEGTLKCVHFYDNQYKSAKALIKNDTVFKNSEMQLPEIDTSKSVNQYKSAKALIKNDTVFKNSEMQLPEIDTSKSVNQIIDDLNPEDFRLLDYIHDGKMQVKMIAPKKI